MVKRLLLTGAGGFMGSHVLRHLLANTNWHIVLTDSFRHRGKTDRITTQANGFDRGRYSVITHDLTVPISDQLAGRIGPIDYVLNLASESHVDRSIEDPASFIRNNVEVVLTMLDYARRYPVKKFIQISTDEVFGPAPDGYAHKEGEAHRPSNPYSASKAAQEDICFSYWRTFGLPIMVSNTMNLVGELQDVEKFVPMTIRRVLRGETMTIHASAAGRVGTRHYLHGRNQADALLFMLNNVKPVAYADGVTDLTRLNVVGEREVDNLEMAQMIAAAVGQPLKYKLVDFHSSRPGHDLRYALDGSKLAAMGWTAPFDLETSLRRTVEWTLAHPEWLGLPAAPARAQAGLA